jgi:paraquat-inducible protein B
MLLWYKESKFWNTSGLHIEAGIFSGVNIDSESVETLIAGGIAFATPESSEVFGSSQGELPASFILHKESDTDWLEWQPKITLGQAAIVTE